MAEGAQKIVPVADLERLVTEIFAARGLPPMDARR
jgi:hypothetical protein